VKPRRSVLYMPGANTRAMEKARDIDCDTIIFDLEDAVSPDAKVQAREQVLRAVDEGGYGYRELIVRANGLETPWGADDVAAFAAMNIDGMLFPKIDRVEQVEAIVSSLDAAGGQGTPVWLMIETPLGIIDLRAVGAASSRVEVLIMGTSDLVKELRAEHTDSRSNLTYALQRAVLVARSLGLDVLDGVHLDFRNLDSFREACLQGAQMGFDGKTLIHPGQVEIANEVFGLDASDIEHARAVLAVWHEALEAGKGVAVLDGQLVENLHAADAERAIAFADALAARR